MNASLVSPLKRIFYSTSFRVLFFLIVIYVVVVARWGYVTGRNDSMQLAYSVYLNHTDLFKNDFFIQSIHEKFPNERTVFNTSISVFGDHPEAVSLIGHILFSLLLFLGIFKISGLFIQNELLKYLALLVLFVPLYNINIGSCELYYNSFISSNVAKAFGIWAIYLYLTKKPFLSSVLFAFSALYHPLAGLLPFVVICGVEGIFFLQKKVKLKTVLLFFFPFVLIALPFIFLEAKNYNDGNFNESELYNIFFKFRNAHHFIPSYFSLKSIFILLPLWVIALVFFRKENQSVFYFILVLIFGCVVYIIAVQWLHSSLFASSQWFKNTIWIEMFSVIAVFALLEKKIKNSLYHLNMRFAFISLSAICFIFIGYVAFTSDKRNINYDFIPGKQFDAAVDISLQAKEKTSKDALFITPLNFTELKYYGLKSTYVDFKSPVHRKSKIIEWMKRINLIYGVDYLSKNTGFDLVAEADSNYVHRSTEMVKELKQYGITNILTYKWHKLDLQLIGENKKFRIYTIP